MNIGKLKRNSYDRWDLLDAELTSGDPVDLLIEGHWISGQIEFWNSTYYWFSRRDGVPVVLNVSLTARLGERRLVNI
jgi:hypothetical protein